MPEEFDQFSSQANLRQTAFDNAVARNTVDRAASFRNLGFDVEFDENDPNKFTKSFSNDPFSRAGQLFQGEADSSRDAIGADFQRSGGGIGSGGLFNQAQADVRRTGDLGRLQIESDFAKTQAQFTAANTAEQNALTGDLAQIGIDKKLSQEFDRAESPEEADSPDVPASGKGVSFKVGNKTKNINSKKDLIKFLKGRGKNPKTWIKNHPEAARQLGFKVIGDNTAANKGNETRSQDIGKPRRGQFSRSGKRLTGEQIRRFNKKNPGSKRFRGDGR